MYIKQNIKTTTQKLESQKYVDPRFGMGFQN